MDRFRFDRSTGKVYEFDNEADAYIFCGFINDDETEISWIRQYTKEE